MPASKSRVAIELDADTKRMIDRAAKFTNQSAESLLENAATERARNILIEWAVNRHRRGDATYSELAEQTGLTVEEIMLAFSATNVETSLEDFLQSVRSIAEATGNHEIVRYSEAAAQVIRDETRERPR
jgi:hypothetical protein